VEGLERLEQFGAREPREVLGNFVCYEVQRSKMVKLKGRKRKLIHVTKSEEESSDNEVPAKARSSDEPVPKKVKNSI
jgi:hypothetical protein